MSVGEPIDGFSMEAALHAMMSEVEARYCREQPVLVTGGALGADRCWLDCCLKAGRRGVVCSFRGHASSVPVGTMAPGLRVHCFSDTELCEADALLEQAGRHLNRRLPQQRAYARRLLQRNYHIARRADSMFAVSCFLPETFVKQPGASGIAGGTAWACELFLLKLWDQLAAAPPQLVPLYFFSQDGYDPNAGARTTPAWYQCHLAAPLSGTRRFRCFWQPLPTLPAARGSYYAGIGTRELNEIGRAAILSFYSSA